MNIEYIIIILLVIIIMILLMKNYDTNNQKNDMILIKHNKNLISKIETEVKDHDSLLSDKTNQPSYDTESSFPICHANGSCIYHPTYDDEDPAYNKSLNNSPKHPQLVLSKNKFKQYEKLNLDNSKICGPQPNPGYPYSLNVDWPKVY